MSHPFRKHPAGLLLAFPVLPPPSFLIQRVFLSNALIEHNLLPTPSQGPFFLLDLISVFTTFPIFQYSTVRQSQTGFFSSFPWTRRCHHPPLFRFEFLLPALIDLLPHFVLKSSSAFPPSKLFFLLILPPKLSVSGLSLPSSLFYRSSLSGGVYFFLHLFSVHRSKRCTGSLFLFHPPTFLFYVLFLVRKPLGFFRNVVSLARCFALHVRYFSRWGSLRCPLYTPFFCYDFSFIE